MDTQLINRISDMVINGTSIEDINVTNITPLSESDVDRIVTLRSRNENDNGDHRMNVRFVYMTNRDSYTRRDSMMPSEQWCDEYSDNVILTTLKGKRDRSSDDAKQASYDAMIELHHNWNDAFKEYDITALVDTSNVSNGIPEFLITNLHENVAHVYLPPSYSDDTVTFDDITCRRAGDAWIQSFDDTWEPYNHNDIHIGYIKKSLTNTLFALIVSPYHDADGNIINQNASDNTLTSIVARAVAQCNGVDATADDPIPDLHFQLYDDATAAIDLVRTQLIDINRRESRLQVNISEARENIDDYSQRISGSLSRIKEWTKELKQIEAGSRSGVVAQLASTVSDLERIRNESFVDHANLVRENDNLMLRVKLKPLVLDCHEQEDYQTWVDAGNGEDYINGRGEPTYRIMENMMFDLRIGMDDPSPNRSIRWHVPDTNPAGYETRKPHPHCYTDGRACYGGADTPINESLNDGKYHDVVQWVSAWANGFNEAEGNFTQHWLFKPAPEGATTGWVM